MREKEAYNNKRNIVYFGVMIFNVWGVPFFFVSDNFEGTFVDFCFMMFTEVLMEELAPILVHVRKIFNCRVSFKMLLSMYLSIIEKEPSISCDQLTFRMILSKKLP